MNDVRKVPASAGAEWLLGGFGLLRKAPLGLGLLGSLYGVLALLMGMSAQRDMGVFMLLELALVLAGPLLLGGFVYAARSVDAGGRAEPGQLLQGVRSGRTTRLLATLLPQMLALLLCALLLVLLVGPAALAQIAQAMEQAGAQAKPDPALFASLPLGRLMLWFLLVLVVGVVASFFTFVATPEIMFTDSSALAAMQRSFRACVRNLPALVVFLVLLVIAVIAIYIAIMLVGLVARLALGEMAMQVVVQVLAMAVFMPVVTGAMYFAWKQMLSAGDTAAVAAPATGFEA
ncbi:hypothetical protein MQC88_10505 [Luteimonas sp. 50]|uniref:Transmembrane protein n=1 Tax=Cognatiluteimonas sedimenti TaxID=2927791 RepID=A0ABT0A5V8_9GAMM|nr:BPSS1780 family membrane protein [Lysobacter sedimenti]MCJ0826376.1 hypothetical protein [Lysobacter sedimenti]